MWQFLLTALEGIIEKLEDAPEASGDTEALVRMELAEVLAAARMKLRALAADEKA